MTPVISPTLLSSSSSLAISPASPAITRSISTSSVHSLAAQILVSAASSSSSIRLAEGEVEVVQEEGLRHANVKLSARHYKMPSFASELLECLRSLQIPSWSSLEIGASDIRIHKVSGSMTNAVFFVSCPSIRGVRTLLLRIYGPSSGSLISRPRELHTLHILSSQYRIGPRVFGTFENGRIEEFFDSTTLTPQDIRDPEVSRWVGARMAELHLVDIELIEGTSPETRGEGAGWEIGAKANVKSWLAPAREVLALPAIPDDIRTELDLQRFKQDWDRYMQWLSKVDDVNSGSRRVFAHNDAQYGNLLRLTNPKEGLEPHRQIIVVDFEYASPNPASFDIANHFHEWTANYHGPTPHVLDPSRYPTAKERRNFYKAYIQHTNIFGALPCTDEAEVERRLLKLDEQVRIWSPASHAMWATWGIVQAREDVENNVAEVEFDYISYARGRMSGFRRELNNLGLL